ncbi:hypothetical protein DSM106972_076850 [Dulcicalothrix desertica PCC 7102]|uniref:Glycosyltransferase 2-like domain-containing protein n=1 Tax=Dulcicalothrix desertica PCC 7102 TaxID=232991 RepID=A0A3S1IPI6_9CYAN|nr:glycosyltransferase family 2 protein [Dulcicalothrix desertica]RUT00237.1 hypothetical protein DSM106972_076850 [Dulcicalothrix desertica PCC 7102]TWH55704.1 glycosyltransferase involved in cell wall biosynthesis [Dulcicalothrix desertica PCC 7102]
MINVITPVYNNKRFIESCIKVVIDQNCLDVEHIIVDGGSTDGTVDIIKHYAESYPHIRWISEKDKGQSDAMNKGIKMAQGEVTSFLNVDDYYEPNVLNRVTEFFKTLPNPSLLVGNCNLRNDNDEIFVVNKPRKLKLNDLLLGWHINPLPSNPSAYFYHTSLHQIIGFYDLEDHYTMDLDFILRAVQAATVKYVDESWGNFRVIQGTKSFMGDLKGQTETRIKTVLDKHYKELPLFQQWQIASKRYFLNNKYWFDTRFKYFSERPEEFPLLIKKKMFNKLSRLLRT